MEGNTSEDSPTIDDPLKLVEYLQSYIRKLQKASKIATRLKDSKKPYEQLSFDYQKARDLPPSIRAAVEDNRMLKSFCKEWKTRCISAENTAIREHRRAERFRSELAAVRETNTERHPKLQKREMSPVANSDLKEECEKKNQTIEVLERKINSDRRGHQMTLLYEERCRDQLQKETGTLKTQISSLEKAYRKQAIELRAISAKYHTAKREILKWKGERTRDIKNSPRNLADGVSGGGTRPKEKQSVPGTPSSETVVLMLLSVNDREITTVGRPRRRETVQQGIETRLVAIPEERIYGRQSSVINNTILPGGQRSDLSEGVERVPCISR